MSANPATFAELVKLANLASIRAVSMSADAGYASGLRGLSSLTASVDDGSPEWTLSEDRTRLTALVSFEVKISHTEVEASFVASITYELTYVFDRTLDNDPKTEEALAGFARANPRFHAWPFLREYVNYATSCCQLPLTLLPLLKPYAKRKDVGTVPDKTNESEE